VQQLDDVHGGNMRLTHLKFALPIFLAAGALAAGVHHLTHVPSANPKSPGTAQPNILSPELIETIVAQGSVRLENPSALTSFYGYDNDGPQVPVPGDLPSASHKVEATKTEPDKNTYLVLEGQKGTTRPMTTARISFSKGHENGASGQGYITRINLDADGAHRVTLLATTDVDGHTLPTLDGSTWYPFSQKLLFTSESGNNASILQASLDFPPWLKIFRGSSDAAVMKAFKRIAGDG